MVTSFRTTRDRFGRLHRVRVISFVGLGYPGYYGDYPYYDNGYDQSTDQGSYDNTQQSSQPDYDQGPPAPSQYATATAPPPDATVPDAAQLILMRKDGQIVMPAAFTISGDKLVYVTREGARLSFPLADLDKDTTRKMNAANGTNVVIPD
jgi:hypothetical protein